MKFLFIIQGEGRGHMTQAIALYQQLRQMGHTVCAACVGKSNRREIPAFFTQNLQCSVHLIDSPNFVTDRKHKGVLLGKTVFYNFLKIKTYKKSLRIIDDLVKVQQPDVILNFYDLLGGIYNAFFKPACYYWVIGHQYLIYHPDFIYAPQKGLRKILFQINTKLTALGADKMLALSFRKMDYPSGHKLVVLPPLLRKSLRTFMPKNDGFMLVYMVNPGYGPEVVLFAEKNPQIKIEAFWDNKNAPDPYAPFPNLTFHKVNDSLFLEKMSLCRGVVSTAGFESICEAMYLGKPVMMVPVKGQYEQACNALDAQISGAGIISDAFDFKVFDKYLNSCHYKETDIKHWVSQFDFIFEKILSDTHAALSIRPILIPDFK